MNPGPGSLQRAKYNCLGSDQTTAKIKVAFFLPYKDQYCPIKDPVFVTYP